MAYRTYKELFRVRAEISSIGTGSKRIVLPEWCQISADTLIIAVITLPVTRFIVAPITNLIVAPLLNAHGSIFVWIQALLMSGGIGLLLNKKEAAGKSPLQFFGTLLGFAARTSVNGWHDGWETRKIELKTHRNVHIFMSRYDDRECGSLPAQAYGLKRFTLTSAAAVKVRGDRIDFTKRGNRLAPGKYEIQGKKVVLVQNPMRRKPPSLHEEDEE